MECPHNMTQKNKCKNGCIVCARWCSKYNRCCLQAIQNKECEFADEVDLCLVRGREDQ
jgi:hypothetical protein